MPRTFFDALPDLYRNMLPDFFHNEFPEEYFATCSNCPMTGDCAPDELLARKKYLQDAKCCTYFPRLPNYLVGAVLSSEDPAHAKAQQKMQTLIERKTGINPLGIDPNPVYWVLFQHNEGAFGRSKKLLCPYFDEAQNNCGIWGYRNNVCLTWFCKHFGGASGKHFWDSLMAYLEHVQNSLRQYVLQQYQLKTVPEHKLPSPRELDDLPPTAQEYRHKWQSMEGKEIEFYQKAYELILQLDQSKFEALVGMAGHRLLEELEAAYHTLMTIPDHLQFQQQKVDWSQETVHIRFKEIGMFFNLPRVVLEQFDGQTTYPAIKARLLDEHSLQLDDGIVRCLYHFQYLCECRTPNIES